MSNHPIQSEDVRTANGLTYYWDDEESTYIVADPVKRIELFKSTSSVECREFCEECKR